MRKLTIPSRLMADGSVPFVDQMKELGWRGADLARKLDLHPNAVSKWRTGKSPVPGYAKAYLQLALKVKRLAEEIL